MIAYLKGKIIHQSIGWLILDVNNVGYKIYTSSPTPSGQEAEFFIHEHIREDANDLYGFAAIDELTIFEQLLSVSGVGPKMALNLLALSPPKIAQAISSNDDALLTSVPGVGKKLAAKIIIELKNKLGTGSYIFSDSTYNTDLIAALEQLGYKQAEILNAIKDMPSDLTTTQSKLTWSLQQMKKR